MYKSQFPDPLVSLIVLASKHSFRNVDRLHLSLSKASIVNMRKIAFTCPMHQTVRMPILDTKDRKSGFNKIQHCGLATLLGKRLAPDTSVTYEIGSDSIRMSHVR